MKPYRADISFPQRTMEARTNRDRSVALVNRLLVIDGRIHNLEHHRAALAAALAQKLSSGGVRYEDSAVPPPQYEWPLTKIATPSALPAGYDARVDDPVLLEAYAGRVFLAEYGLLGPAPDFAGAVAHLNETCERAPKATPTTPDVSIIIPIYGQLGYTLNCLDSLQKHVTRLSMEIIVVDDASPDESKRFLRRVRGIRYLRQPKNGGFVDSCNSGGLAAHGRFIVLLNNDTRVVTGWLDELIGGFNLFPAAGLLGSKLHYEDGSLQEAGGIIWRDGSAWNYGRHDDPNRPEYAYARQVDYISGASIALPAPLWHSLGGFDPRFRPAYAEDADLALRVRAQGRQVWLQPQSRLVHYEGKTCGTDTTSGVKAYQPINMKRLYLRWREDLATHRPNGQAPYLERERNVRKRLLVIDASVPRPDEDAGSMQTYMALRTAVALGYKTSFVAQDNWQFQQGYTTALQRHGVECAYAPYDLDFETYMRRHGPLLDAVMVYRPGVLQKTLATIREFAPQAVTLYHVADLHHLRMQRTAELANDPDLLRAATEMRDLEYGLVEAADCTITHSDVENQMLRVALPASAVTTWPLMVDYVGTQAGFAARHDLCFLGGYRHPPNVDAAVYFVREILPLVRQRHPGLKLILAGSHMPDDVRALAGPGVEIAGMVPDLATLFDRCRVFVCPLRIGAGVKGKVASALAHGIPVVSTSVGVEGAGLQDGQDVLVADSPAAFADCVLRLHDDLRLWNALSTAGQTYVRDKLSLQMGMAMLAQAVDAAYSHKLGL